jgi:tetrahydromethanopterin S-methyltransferase subunit G
MIRMKQNPDISYGMRTRKLEKIESKLKWLSLESSQLIYNREQKNISVIYGMEGMKYIYGKWNAAKPNQSNQTKSKILNWKKGPVIRCIYIYDSVVVLAVISLTISLFPTLLLSLVVW